MAEAANDQQNRAQNLNENLGKILRVDVAADRFPNDNAKYGYAIPAGNSPRGIRKFLPPDCAIPIVTALTGRPGLSS